MPFAGFKDFDDCKKKMIGKGYSTKSSEKICGKLQAQHESKKEE